MHVRYTNANAFAVQTARLKSLQRNSNVFLIVGNPSQSTLYAARVWRHNGALHKKLMKLALEGPPQSVRCHGLRARWSPATATVRVSVPHSCLDVAARRLFMRAEAVRQQDRRDGSRYDLARGAVVRRG